MKIALIDDDAAVLDSLRMLLTNRGLGVECFMSADDFLTRSESMALSCIVSDVRMPDFSGLELQSELMRRGSTVPLILMTGHGDIAMAVSAIKMGAFDFIEKPFDDNNLEESIRRAIANNERRQTQDGQIANTLKRVRQLSQRQRQVMDLVSRGLSNKEIALSLRISPRTVENYRAWVMEKMGVSNLAELVRLVVQLQAADLESTED